MRPVVRGSCPQDSTGNDVVFTKYTQARGELIKRLGERCSYCEMHLDSSLAVEHVQPKKPPGATQAMPERELAWDNFLLACTNCNSIKDNKDVVLGDYVWPDRDNSFMALTYSEGGLVHAAKGPHETQALAMIKLVGLDRKSDANEASDRRWQNRHEAWELAQDSLEDYVSAESPELRRQIIRTVKTGGYWSIWMTVFKDHPAMLQDMIKAIPGTAAACFDSTNGYAAVAR